MGYRNMNSTMTGREFLFQRRAGIGDLTTTITDALPDAYSDTSTITGLPLVWEIGLGLVGAYVLLGLVGRASGSVSRSYTRSRRKREQTGARKAALKAELAAL